MLLPGTVAASARISAAPDSPRIRPFDRWLDSPLRGSKSRLLKLSIQPGEVQNSRAISNCF